ncbi:MAG: carboxylating nicotinate-nucleotide diphosphorylase [Euryarchaeota archaeon]|nr:carboxylating nicotinate-nucleotide diphosphorylase [Euryarchaeota archaeon]
MHPVLLELLRFLREDTGFWDVTTESVVPETEAEAEIVAKQECVLAGVRELELLCSHFGVECSATGDGAHAHEGSTVAELRGSARTLLLLERTVLNMMMRMSGIATATRRLVEVAGRYGVRLAGTRKTTPGFRYFEKRAIAIGGGDPHRFRLDDAVLIKHNHLRFSSLEEAVRRAKRVSFTKLVEVEVSSPEQALLAAEAGADAVMLDNFTPEQVEQVLEQLRSRVLVEVSGGITPENIESYARLKPHVISTSWMCTSAPWVDMSMRVVKP